MLNKKILSMVAIFVASSFSVFGQNSSFLSLSSSLGLSKVTFESETGELRNYATEMHFNQAFGAGIATPSGFTIGLDFAKTDYSGVSKGIDHEVYFSQLQTSMLLGYTLKKATTWSFLAGPYYGQINQARSIAGQEQYNNVNPYFTENDMGLNVRISTDIQSKGSPIAFSPFVNGIVGLQNIEGDDAVNGQSTRLASYNLGISVKYIFKKPDPVKENVIDDERKETSDES